MKKPFIAILCLLSLCVSGAYAETRQSHAEIHKTVLAFIQSQTQDMPGQITVKLTKLDPRVSLPACSQLEAFLQTGSSILGKTSIGIRCNEKNGWSLFVSATITMKSSMLVSSRPLPQGKTITSDDYSIQSGELSQQGIITGEAQVKGKILKFSIGAGQLLNQDMFRSAYIVTQGQTVQIVSDGPGFKLRNEGLAMGNAAAGQSVQVKVSTGQIITGIAKEDGTVGVR
jgi:flagella basal body P-ring formation protein FlgA